MSFQPIQTQEEFDAAVQERIHRETAKYADYDSLKAKAGKYDALADKTKTPEQRIQEAETALAAANLTNLRMKAAIAHGLPVELADRISGSSESEINADAEKLSGFFPAQESAAQSAPPPAPLASTEGAAPVSTSDAALMDLASKL